MSGSEAQPPVARRETTVWESHGHQRPDDYAWMKDDTAGLREYLLAERAYYDAATAPTAALQATLFEEMSRRVAPADDSVGWRRGDFVYNLRQPAGQQYPKFCREAGGEVTVLLDLNKLAGDSAHLGLGVRELSPDGSLLAYSVDSEGDEVFALRIRDLATGTDLPDLIPRSSYGCAWSADATALLYVVTDAAYRPYRVMRHLLGTTVDADTIAYEDADERFFVELAASRSGEVVVITSVSTNCSEVWLLSTADVDADPWCVSPRRDGIEYFVEPASGGELFIVTNDSAEEFRLMRAPLRSADASDWTEFIATDPAVRLIATAAFAGHLVVTFRRDGYRLLRIIDLATGVGRDEGANLPAGQIRLSATDAEWEPVLDPFDSTAVTVVIESMIEPPSWWSIDLATGARTRLKTVPTPTYDAADYVTTRITVAAADGAEIPVTLAYRGDVARDGTAPCLLYGYGAYEYCIDPDYDPQVASLLDRGVVYAVASIRGGGELGRRWWRQGSVAHKRNSFTDFIAAASGLAEQGWVDGDRIACWGASAGGLLVGAALSIAPDRWRAVVAEVPFVDVVTTMLDPSVPLTAGEWEEWGDPRQPADYDYMASYSPYDNVPTGPRPPLLATGSVNDSRVMVREPAKWVARLRATRTDDSTVLFRAEAGSGSHRGPSGRYDRLRYQSEIVAFVLDKLDVE